MGKSTDNGTAGRSWWKEALVYQIYPRSFQDSNGDGIGDLQGIASRLDYIKSLGVDVIWLNPIFRSPNDDMGYDISDYREIMPEFGTMADFDELLEKIHARGMKLILDLVVNHTSDEHPWFSEARKSRANPYYRFYHWWPAEKGSPPLRASYFDEEGYAWKYNEPTDSYYLHYFGRKQPDLNWDNPEVREAVYDIMRFWFDKGIDGFRMDSIPLIGKDPAYPAIDSGRYPSLFDAYAVNPLTHLYLHEMNLRVLSRYDNLNVGEGSAVKVADAWKFVDPERRELQMLYHFGPSEVRTWTAPDSARSGLDYSLRRFKKMFDDWDKKIRGGWPVIYLGNHDQPRMVSRFGSDAPPLRGYAAKMLATFILTMRGTPYWYAGDEIGMANARFAAIDDYRDIATLNQYKRILKEAGDMGTFMENQQETSRDNSRTPFQWDAGPNAGFTSGTPWIGVNGDYRKVNAAAQEKEPGSPLNYFRRVVKLRKSSPALRYGDFELVDPRHEKIFAFTRTLGNDSLLIALNFTPLDTRMRFPAEAGARPLLHNYPDTPAPGKILRLRPFEALVYSLAPQ